MIKMKYLPLIFAFVFTLSCKNSKKAEATTENPPATALEKQEEPTSYNTADKPERQKALPEKVASDDALVEVAPAERDPRTQADPSELKPFMADDSFFKMSRTPCFGRCPVYKLEIKQNGFAILEGIRFFDFEGVHEGQLSETQLNQITALADQYGYFKMEHVYDAPVTDLPSTTTALRTRDGFHWVYNRMDAPQTLFDFENAVEALVKEVQWKPSQLETHD
jgi:hypothetical protein